MRHQKKIITLIISILMVSTMGNAHALTQGWGIGPNIVNLTDGLKNATYQQTIWIYNENDYDSNVSIGAEGEVKNWLTFYEPDNLTVPIDTTFVNKTSSKDFILQIDIPEDTANGVYTGTITITPKFYNPETKEYETLVNLNFPINMSLTVTGEQNLNVSIESITIDDTEINFDAESFIQ